MELSEENKGKRVELIHTSDPYTKLKPGIQGTYQFELKRENPLENSHAIKWDDGSNLMMIHGDKWKFI